MAQKQKSQAQFVKSYEATINPLTGKLFVDEAEHKAFVDDQTRKREEMNNQRRQRDDERLIAVNKVLKVFKDAGITEEEIYLVFGRNFR